MLTSTASYRLGLAAWALSSLFLFVLSLGVGLIGADGDPANLMYLGVLAVGVVGAVVARLRPAGMARTSSAMAALQAVIGAVAVVGGLGRPYSGALELVGLTALFVALFGAAAWLFGRAEAPPP